MSHPCPDCGARLEEGRTCADDFHQMLFWESEYPGAGVVHHLTVLGYHLQHPALYSPEGLAGAQVLLVQFLDDGLPPSEVRRRNKAALASGRRTYTIKASKGARGAYPRPIAWRVTSADVVAAGPDHYVESVRGWAAAILADLRQAGLAPAAASRHPQSQVHER